jgi:hypothetical protein
MKNLVVAAALLCSTAARAAADPLPAERNGLLIGFGVGLGTIEAECADCGDVLEAGGLEFRVGTMMRPGLALLLDVWGMGHTEDRVTLTHVIATGALRWWAAPRFWLQGGVGFARAGWAYDAAIVTVRDETEAAPAVMVGAGYEIAASRRFTIDLTVRAGTGFYEEARGHNLAVGAGFTWY